MTKDELLSYAAGYIDGDGCVSAVAVKSRGSIGVRIGLEISSKRVPVLNYLEGVLGPGHIYKQKDGTARLGYYCRKASAALETVAPYLFLKRRQAELAILLQSKLSAGGFSNRHGLPESFRLERAEIVRQVKSLNQRHCPLLEHEPRAKKRCFAYLAGIIDSEGCLKIDQKRFEFFSILHVVMTDGYVSEWLKKTFGGYVIKINHGELKPLYRWGIESKSAAECLRKAKPYLRSKREQAEILIRLQRHKELWKTKLHGGALPEAVVEKRFKWRKRVGLLNQCADAEAEPTQPISVSDGPICQDGKLVELPMAATAKLAV